MATIQTNSARVMAYGHPRRLRKAPSFEIVAAHAERWAMVGYHAFIEDEQAGRRAPSPAQHRAEMGPSGLGPNEHRAARVAT